MATIIVDGKSYEVKDGQNLLQACLSVGLNLPYFCWHPGMGSVGACRQCAVKQFRDENDTRGRIVMACLTPAANGARISIDDPQVREFRASVIEWLMESHPHDCPVCDEGGECHLQDMTVMSGHNYRRYRGKKRTWRNQDLGPFVNHEMNRCIQCYRCVRFYRDYAGGRDFDAFGLRNLVYFGRQADGVLESEFSGNLVEVCPTGVFTDKTLKKKYTRKWDLQTAPSVCVNCGLGCNTIPGERYGELRRLRNRYNGAVNGYFLCDRGRYGYEFVNSERRLRRALVRSERSGPAAPLGRVEALQHVAGLLDGKRVIGIGSPRATLEANYALRTLVGPQNFYGGVSRNESVLVTEMLGALQNGPAPSASLQDARASDAVLVLGEDVTNTAPMLALALRQSVRLQPMKKSDQQRIPRWDDYSVREILQDEKGPCYIASVTATRLDDIAAKTVHAAPDDLARLGFAVARAISGEEVEEDAAPAKDIAAALLAADQPLVVGGSSLGSTALVHAAANVAWALRAKGRPAFLSFVAPECNSLGLGMMAAAPLEDAFTAAHEGKVDAIIVLENDLYRRAEAAAVDAFLGSGAQMVVIDCLETPTTQRADAVFPAATFAEGNGTLVNSEGRAQRFFEVFVPAGDTQESWTWCKEMAGPGSAGRGWWTIDDVDEAMAGELPQLKLVTSVAPGASFRIGEQKIARQTARVSGRTAIQANIAVSEPKPPQDTETPFNFSMEGYQQQPPAALIPRYWAPGWNSVQALNRFQEEIAGPLRGGDPGQRLLSPAAAEDPPYFGDVPQQFAARQGQALIVPLYHIFGSEEMSLLTPGVAGRAPAPYLALNPSDAAGHNLHDGQEVDLALGGLPRRLTVRIDVALPVGVAGIPTGVPGLHGIALPTWSELP